MDIQLRPVFEFLVLACYVAVIYGTELLPSWMWRGGAPPSDAVRRAFVTGSLLAIAIGVGWGLSEVGPALVPLDGTVVQRGTGGIPGSMSPGRSGYWIKVELANGTYRVIQVERAVFVAAPIHARVHKKALSTSIASQL